MANAHSTLASLFTDIAKAIRSKTGGTASIVADNFPTAISSIEVKENLDAELSAQDSLIAQISTALVGKAGVALPVLSNPAGAGNIQSGYQAVDGAGRLIEGSADIPTFVTGTIKGASSSFYEWTIPAIAGKKNVLFFDITAHTGATCITTIQVANGVVVQACGIAGNATKVYDTSTVTYDVSKGKFTTTSQFMWWTYKYIAW